MEHNSWNNKDQDIIIDLNREKTHANSANPIRRVMKIRFSTTVKKKNAIIKCIPLGWASYYMKGMSQKIRLTSIKQMKKYYKYKIKNLT